MAADKGTARRAGRGSPLLGKRIVITRARSQASAFARGLEELGGVVIEFPTIEIRPPDSYDRLDEAVRNIASYDWLVFTSVNGVDRFCGRARRLRKNIRKRKDARIVAIGPGTAKRLESEGLHPDLVPGDYRAEGILEGLKPEELRGKRVLLPRAARAREILPETLRRWGAEVDVLDAYRTVVPRSDVSGLRKLLTAKKIDMVTFTSSSTAAHFATLFSGENLAELLAGTAVACIGPITENTVRELGVGVDVVSTEYTIPGLIRAIADYFGAPEKGDSQKAVVSSKS